MIDRLIREDGFMPFAPINGIDLYYEDHAGPSPDAAVVVFLHGAGGNHLSWWQQIPRFRQRYRCVTIDHRGYGATADPERTGWVHYGADLVALLDHLDIERAALVAQSMGGRTALDAAVRVPDRISALVMADTWGFFQWPENMERSAAAIAALAERRAQDRPVMVAESFGEREPARLFLYQQVGALNLPNEERPANPFSEGGPSKEQVAALRMSVLFLEGAEDIVVPPPVVRAAHELIAGSEYREVAGCGHSVYWEAPDTFNEIVEAFLDGKT